ncbi:hypothetical protein STEG23_036254 [Scotinomys teguina]
MGIPKDGLQNLANTLEGDKDLNSPRELSAEAEKELALVEKTIQEAHVDRVNPELKCILVILPSRHSPTGILMQREDVILEWIFLPHKPSKKLKTYIEKISDLIHKEFGRLKYVHHTIDPYSGFQWATSGSPAQSNIWLPSLLLYLPPRVLRLTGNFYILSSWRAGVFSSCCLALDSSSSFPCPTFRAIAKSASKEGIRPLELELWMIVGPDVWYLRRLGEDIRLLGVGIKSGCELSDKVILGHLVNLTPK